MTNDSPPPTAESVEQELVRAVEVYGGGDSPIAQSVAAKVTSKNLSELVELQRLKETNRHAEATARQNNLPTLLTATVGGLLVFVLVLAWLCLHYGKAEVIVPILSGLSGLIAGAAAGYGIGRGSGRKG